MSASKPAYSHALLLTLVLASLAAVPARSGAGGPVAQDRAGVEEDEADEEELQQRLTEREDKRRPLEPFTMMLAGRPLVLGGEIELESDWLRPRQVTAGNAPGDRDHDHDVAELGIEAEAFYSFGRPLSLFAQVRLVRQQDLRGDDGDASGGYLERGEMWLYSADVLGSGVDLDVGRLDFEDDRRWWWDDELDALRLTIAPGPFELALAYARELAPERSDRDGIDPDHAGVRRLIGEASWDWASDHSLQVFALHQDDRSRTGAIGQVVAHEREDDSDARLTWFGVRAIGVGDIGRLGLLGYWLDWARVRGVEQRIEYEPLSPQRSQVTGITRADVRGTALDVGFNWLLPLAAEPRVFGGFATGSGDRDADDGRDHAFRQTGLQSDEAGFGGVEHYPQYGVLLDPELSNLRIETLGAGISLPRSSSLDLVWHRYRLQHPAEELRDAPLELALDGRRHDLGHAFDLALALEEWERFELFAVLSGLRPGAAVLPAQRGWRYGAFVALRFAF